MMKGTTFIEEPLKNIKCDLGIFLDVYPLDNISDDEENLKSRLKLPGSEQASYSQTCCVPGTSL